MSNSTKKVILTKQDPLTKKEIIQKIKANGKKKKLNVFARFYRFLCWIGLRLQFATYNKRRRIKKFFSPVSGRLSAFFRAHVVVPVSGAWREFREICGSTEGFGNTFRQHKGFFAGVVNVILPVICIAVLAVVIANVVRAPRALEVSCNGKVLGYIEDEGVYNSAVKLLSQRTVNTSRDYTDSLTPSYTMASVSSSMNMSSETLCEALLADSSDVENAYGLYINGALCAAAKSYGDIQFIMESFLDQYKTGTPGEKVTFMGTTDIISGLYSTDRIVSSDKFAKTISTKRTETQIYTVMEGDTAQSIANVANMSYARLIKINENLGDTPEPGTSVLLEKELPVLKVQTVRTVKVKEKINFSKKTVKNDKQYTSYSKCITKGVPGEREVLKQVTEINGVQVASEVISSTVTRQPVDAVYEVGTKKAPTGSRVGTGRFTWPVPGVHSISSPFGPRWGKLHRGVDISCGGIYGRTVVAADSGTATVSRMAGGYGLHIIISHGNGYSTCYAHLSAATIRSGSTVSKGQAIGRVGSTGHSTGPHLHFEIRRNNTPTNPMHYF